MRAAIRSSGLTMFLLVMGVGTTAAQSTPSDPAGARRIAMAEYAARRAEVLRQIDSGVVVAFGEVEPVVVWPTFFQLPGFRYLTGWGESDAVLLIVKRNGVATPTMFVPARTSVQARWLGARTAVGEMQATTGIQGREISQFRLAVDSLAAIGMPFYVLPDVHTSDFAAEDSLTRGSRFVSELRASHPWLVTSSLYAVVANLRAHKSPAELELLRQAARISVRAHREAVKSVAPGCGENEIQAVLDGTFRRFGGDRPGYGSIVGSGRHATTLHYMRDDGELHAGDLLLIDASTSFDHYSADVTRTLPVSGKFSPAQRELYQLVRDAQEAFVRQIKPGVSLLVPTDSGRRVIGTGLARLGLIESYDAKFDGTAEMNCPPEGCSQRGLYAYHGYGGHGIGLEVHDPSSYDGPGNQFAVGDVFTVEPGLYVVPDDVALLPDTPRNRAMRAKIAPAVEKYKWLGVRVEDDYALTTSGLEWLSAGAPREIAEIEALMRQPKVELPGGGRCGVATGH